jgi:hypothetical protein
MSVEAMTPVEFVTTTQMGENRIADIFTSHGVTEAELPASSATLNSDSYSSDPCNKATHQRSLLFCARVRLRFVGTKCSLMWR